MSMTRFACLCVFLVLCACSDYPRDPEDSLARAHEHGLRVGLSHDPPFVDLSGREPAGIEVDWIRRFAHGRGMEVEWVVDGHDALMLELLDFRLHLVAGGHRRDSPWKDASWSLPVKIATADGLVERRFALPPGENAWQLALDRQLHADAPALANGASR